MWKLFRRELIGEGFHSDVIDKHRNAIKEHLRFLCDNGLLEEETPDSKEKHRAGSTSSSRKRSVKPVAKARDWVTHTPFTSSSATLVASEYNEYEPKQITTVRTQSVPQFRSTNLSSSTLMSSESKRNDTPSASSTTRPFSIQVQNEVSSPECYYRGFEVEMKTVSKSSVFAQVTKPDARPMVEGGPSFGAAGNFSRSTRASWNEMVLDKESKSAEHDERLPAKANAVPRISMIRHDHLSTYDGKQQVDFASAVHSTTESSYRKPTVEDDQSEAERFKDDSGDDELDPPPFDKLAIDGPTFENRSQSTPSIAGRKTTSSSHYTQSHIYRGRYPEDQDYDGIPVADPSMPELFIPDEDLDSLVSKSTTKPKYPKNSKMHGFVIRAFAKADPFGHLSITPDIVAAVMWRIAAELAHRRIEPPPVPWWKLMETEDDEEEKTDERLRDERRYEAKLQHYNSLVKEVSERIVNSFGIEVATKATAQNLKSETFKPGSVEGFIAGAAEIWRSRKKSSHDDVERRKRFFHDVMMTMQVAQARDKERARQSREEKRGTRSGSRSRSRSYRSPAMELSDDRDTPVWTLVFDYFSKLQAGERKEYLPIQAVKAKEQFEPFLSDKTKGWLYARDIRKIKDPRASSPPPPYETAMNYRPISLPQGLDNIPYPGASNWLTFLRQRKASGQGSH